MQPKASVALSKQRQKDGSAFAPWAFGQGETSGWAVVQADRVETKARGPMPSLAFDQSRAKGAEADSFNLNDINLLQAALKENFYLRARLIQKRQEQWAIVIPVRQIQSLASTTAPPSGLPVCPRGKG
jgi:hypothetical protein